MAKTLNIIKIRVEDEDKEFSNEIKENQEKKLKVPARKAKAPADPKKAYPTASKKGSKKRAVIEVPAAGNKTKLQDIPVLIEKISPVKKVIQESGRLASGRAGVLNEIAGGLKLSGKGESDQATGKIDNAPKVDAVKNVVVSALKESEDKASQNQLAEKMKSKRSIKLYKKIVLSFGFLTVALLLAAAYFLLVKATIILIPNQERISNNIIVDVYDRDKSSAVSTVSIKGAVALIKMEQSGVYTASGTEVIGEEAIGQVKIINIYTKNQPLVAGTRLLPPDGNKLYRLKNTVNVPAGGTIKADIYADEPTPESALGPTKFTIPGLWAGLQDKIYAESDTPIVYRQKLKRNIVENDIDAAKQDLRQKLLARAKAEINATYRDYSKIIYKLDEESVVYQIDGRPGDEKEEFTATMRADIIAVACNGQDIASLAREKFISSLPNNKELVSFDESNMIYSLNNYDFVNGVATLNVTFEGKIGLKENSEIIDKSKIRGLSEKELDTYLASLPNIAGFEVIFNPSFIKRVPRLVDRIKVEIKK